MTIYFVVLLAMLNQVGFKGSKMLISLAAIDQGASPFMVGLLVAMYALLPLLLAVQAGRITDRVGVRWPMVFGSLGMTLGLALPAVASPMPTLFLAAGLLGFANIFFHVSCHNLIGSIGSPGDRTANFGLFSLGAAISGMLGPTAAGLSVDLAGYSLAFGVLSALVAVPGIVLLAYGRFVPAAARIEHERKAGGLKELLQAGPMRSTLIASGLVITGIDLFNFYAPIHGRSLGLQASMIGMILGMQAAAAFVVRLAMPWIARRFGEVRVLTWSLVMAGVTYFLFPFFQHPAVLALIAFLLGLALGCGQPLSIVLTYNHSPPGRSGEALGLRLTVNKFTQLGVPLAFGSLGAAFGIYPIFWSSAVLLILGGYITGREKNGSSGEKGRT